jgi:hypothetical protein
MSTVDFAPAPSGAQQIQFSLLRLKSWPDIPRLPAEDVVDMARICALLSWRATAGVIIARLLDLPKDRVQEILLRLHAQGCLNLQAQAGTPAEVRGNTGAANDSQAPESAEPPPNSFITKIWQRLGSRN